MNECAQAEKVVEELLCSTEEDYFRLMDASRMEKWIDELGDLTFQSFSVSMSPNVAAELQALHEDPGQPWSEELVRFAASLEGRFEAIFVRTSMRSPKDAALHSSRLEPILAETQRRLIEGPRAKELEGDEDNRKMVAFCIAQTHALAARSGTEAVELLIASDRIQGDWKEVKEDMLLYVREFRFFDSTLELRAFVHNGCVTALTSYNQFVHAPFHVEHKEEIQQLVCAFLQTHLSKIPDSCVLDLALVPKTKHCLDATEVSDLEVKIVELNPLAEFAGTGLFSWHHDRPVITGKVPFEFRVTEQPPKHQLKLLPVEWKQFLNVA